ncbi:hypothetical protein PISL3812_06013 [Talaromyces islandicus]|uniref:Uncharacterized protein n=1 Tax=Talaromyces islandicus TaxID=28573 RepID=A0A0U1M0A5_TALIS|nr:hypothetical protein PISL3812_06013 [Talaromyces islandicus]
MAGNLSLIGSQNSPGFAQQGQLDWLAIARTPVAFTLDVLARYGRAGVEPVTVGMGRAVCFGFDLRPETQKQLEESRSKIENHFFLWEDSVILQATYFGSCAKIKGAPTDLTPSIRQWTALVRICAEVLSNSQFPRLLTGFERLLDRYNQERDCPSLPDPELLARAINTLGLLSKGSIRSVTYTGGLDCAWIAAMAQWMLCLGVEINDGRGNTLYRSKSLYEDEIAHVIININASYPEEASSLTHKIFSIPQGKSLLSMRDTMDHVSHSAVRMAAPWTEILEASFGKENMDSLLNAPGFAFAIFLKSMSLLPIHVIYKICPWVEFYGTQFPRRKSGMEFLGWAMKRLPELQPCIERSLNQLNGPLSRKQLELDGKHSLSVIQAACKCQHSNETPHVDCLQVIAVTILHYLFILSSLSIDELICPSCTGLRLLHSRSFERYYLGNSASVVSPICALEGTLEILTGQRISVDRLDKPASAISANGICIFYDLFLRPNASPLDISTIRVVPEHIEFESTHHLAIFDTHESLPKPFESPLTRKDEHPPSYSLLVRQKSFDMSIQVSYQMIAQSRPATTAQLGVIQSAVIPKILDSKAKEE